MNFSWRRILYSIVKILTLTAIILFLMYQYALRIEPTWLTTEHVNIPVNNLPSELEGFKIIQLTDLHYDEESSPSFMQEMVERTNHLAPDLIVLTGDYIIWEARPIFALAPILAKLKAKYGVFAILGNHDNPNMVQTAFKEKTHIPLLINQGLNLKIGQTSLYLAGLAPGSQGNLSLALKNYQSTVPIILLVHEPDLADIYAKDQRITLQLSGHTHGGQVRMPFFGALVLPYSGQKYEQGLYRVNQTWVYTSRGIGMLPLPPVRFNCPPEITVITLKGNEN